MDKLNQDMDDQSLLEDIPLLKDIVVDNGDNQKSTSTFNTPYRQPQSKQKTAVIDDQKANPFLPYEHLAKLALEREKFTQSIEAFTENLKHEKTDREREFTIRDASKSHKNDAIVQAITNKVLNQLKPVIEEKIATELSLYFDEIHDDY